ENARKAEEARLAEEARKAEEARRAQEAKRAEDARLAAEAAAAAKRAEEARLADEARKAEEARKAAEIEAARVAAGKADRANFFIEGDFGKERRVRDVVTATTPPLTFGYGFCAPLFGAKAGVDLRLAPGWRLAPAIGVALNTRDSGQSSLFAEAELNRWFGRKGFIGTGIGVWDFTHGDTVAPVWLLQGGRQIWRASGPKANELHFVVTGRMFLNKMDDIANNYQFWAGLRYIMR
ncbi:MAG TPA: hypothetical protein VF332_10915, partial [Vicinamibacterales bacterium]